MSYSLLEFFLDVVWCISEAALSDDDKDDDRRKDPEDRARHHDWPELPDHRDERVGRN